MIIFQTKNYIFGLSICQNFEKSQVIRNMGLPRHIKQIVLAHERQRYDH